MKKHGGRVIELHCYAVKEGMEEAEVRRLFVEEMKRFLPELQNAKVVHESFRMNRDFTAYHVNMNADRPETDVGIDGLYCAGDWVKLPFPAMLMEGAFASGMWAANKVLTRDGLREDAVESVPLRGLAAGMPQSSARKRLLGLP